MLKDVRLCLDEAHAAGIDFEFAQAAERILAEADRAGHGDDDFAALLSALEARTGATLP
jgi:3-hydroxyisobutyrate dehydrogenase-like beta-hydroxyacid dehydrogenase